MVTIPYPTTRLLVEQRSQPGPHQHHTNNTHMFATLCSRPIATKAAMGGQMPSTLPGRLLAAPAFHTATHTSQLARMARIKAWLHGRLALYMAVLMGYTAPCASTPLATTAATNSRLPTKLPARSSSSSTVGAGEQSCDNVWNPLTLHLHSKTPKQTNPTSCCYAAG
eukprot:GHRQ01026243.1.p1 GENE.GHRQ01026243.1~~GHRQ01026243.1.p1  ORF type:complete len:167 (+),score=26.31 GHRQ01026243.1:639-1139(+)